MYTGLQLYAGALTFYASSEETLYYYHVVPLFVYNKNISVWPSRRPLMLTSSGDFVGETGTVAPA